MERPNADEKQFRYFDPKSPEMPQEILGMGTAAILKLGRAASNLGVLPEGNRLGIYALPNAVVLFPLVERVQSGEALTPKDVRPYRRAIKRLIPKLGTADKLAAGASIVGVGVPLRRRLNQRIEAEFPARAQEAIEASRYSIENLKGDIDTISDFENPRQQFQQEIDLLAHSTKSAIKAERNARVEQGRNPELPPPPSGLKGIVVRVVRKVQQLFSWFSHKPKVNTEITAYDAAAGLEKTMKKLQKNGVKTRQKMPLISELVLNRLPDLPLPSRNELAFVAPEILTSIFSLSKDQEGEEILENLRRNPHELRFVTRYKRKFGRFDLSQAQQAALTMLPAIRDILPENGQQLKDAYSSLMCLTSGNSSAAKGDEVKKRLPFWAKRARTKAAQILTT